MRSASKLLSCLCMGLFPSIGMAQSINLAGDLSLPALSIAHANGRPGLCSVQSANKNPLATIGNKAYSEPISEAEIQFQTKDKDGQLVTLRVQEGAMAKVISFKENTGYALIPKINGANAEWVDVILLKLSVDAKGNESIAELGRFTAKPHESAGLTSIPTFQIQLMSIILPTTASNRPFSSRKKETVIAYASADKTRLLCYLR